MQITLVSSGDTVSDVLSQFVSLFCVNESELNLITDSQYLVVRSSIHELKEIADFLLNKFTVDLTFPKRNSKLSLSTWIAGIVSAARQAAVQVSDEVLGTVVGEANSQSDETQVSGLGISFGKTLEFLPRKTVTRRTWKDAHAQKFINAFNQNKLMKAFDKDVRYGGKQIGWCRLSSAPYKERLCDMPSEDLLAEGGMCGTIGEFVQQYFDGNPRLEVWVIRFEFIAGLALAAEINPVVAADQVVDSPSPEIEVLEPEEKPVYTISIIADGKFSEQRVSRLPPYLIDRKGNLLKQRWHCSCDASYSEITSKHLSNIAVNSGLVVRLMAENLEVSQACICGDPPPFIIDRTGGVYKRDRLKVPLAVRYAQVVSEYLSNIVVV